MDHRGCKKAKYLSTEGNEFKRISMDIDNDIKKKKNTIILNKVAYL